MPDTNETRADRQLRDGLGDVGRAFFGFPSLTDVQRASIEPIAEGKNVLVCASTAAGKTEAVIAPLTWAIRRPIGNLSRGPRLLVVAPTRALVADLTARLETPFAQLGWACAAQTSDFRGADSFPEVLITTPESLDSMLVRRSVRRATGEIVAHLLANVAGVFVDEAHCFDTTSRGDQLRFLLARIRKLRETALANGWTATAGLQVCAASATVPAPEILAKRLLGAGARAIICPGCRPIDILTKETGWLRLGAQVRPADLVSQLFLGDENSDATKPIETALLTEGTRKALVFVVSRKACDALTVLLRRRLKKHREIWVGAHHGSLSREHRQRAEDTFSRLHDAVLVATNTLEVGVDIGDVDVVALHGAPPDTSGLLQRIGRGGRRTGLTRIVPIMRDAIDAAAMASELVTAVDGVLDYKHRVRRWDVLPQQVISYIRQNREVGRSQDSLIKLARSVWPESDTASLCEMVIRVWREEGKLEEQRGRLHLSGGWSRFAEHAQDEMTVHSNINSSDLALAIQNDRTGEMIGRIKKLGEGGQLVTMAGSTHRIVRRDGGQIDVVSVPDPVDDTDYGPDYGGRRRPVSQSFAEHVRRGCGIDEGLAPVIQTSNGRFWFHFGGEVFEKILMNCDLALERGLCGIAVRVAPDFGRASLAAPRITMNMVREIVTGLGSKLLSGDSLGRFAPEIFHPGADSFLAEHRFDERLMTWIATLEVNSMGYPQKGSSFAGVVAMAEATQDGGEEQ